MDPAAPSSYKQVEMIQTPLMRAAHVRESLGRLEMFGELGSRIEGNLGQSQVSRIRDSRGATWLPLEVDVAMTRAVAEIAGPDGLDAWCRDAIRASIRGPLLRPVLEGAARVFGLSPGPILGMVPRTFQHVYRHAGALRRDEDAPGRVVFSYQEAPAVVLDDAWYIPGITAALAVVLEICNVGGTATADTGGTTPRLVFEWDQALEAVELRLSG